MTALGSPAGAFGSVHVVGTNGKSSTMRMIAAILARHGCAPAPTCRRTSSLRPSASASATPTSSPRRFAAAVAAGRRAPPSWSTARSPEGDRVTQFEALTAAAYSELAAARRRRRRRRGRARRALGRDERHPVGGAGADQRRPRAHALARPDDRRHRRARSSTSCAPARRSSSGPTCIPTPTPRPSALRAERGARLIVAAGRADGLEAARPGAIQRRNFAVARAAAEAFLGPLDAARRARRGRGDARARAASRSSTPSRSRCSTAPTTRPGHGGAGRGAGRRSSPAGAPARRRRLGARRQGRRGDAAARCCRACAARRLHAAARTRARSRRRRSPRSPASSAAGRRAEIEPDPRRALGGRARARRADGVVVATGSIYLVADLCARPGARGEVDAVNEDGPSLPVDDRRSWRSSWPS